MFDEAWSENDHDFVYKLYAGNKKLVLNRTSNLLSKVAEVADELSMFMHDYYDESIFSVPNEKAENKKTLEKSMEKSTYEFIESRKYDNLHSRSIASKSVKDINDLY